jgi:hypothetical protein
MDSPVERAALVPGVTICRTVLGVGMECNPDRTSAIATRIVSASPGNFTEFVIFVAPCCLGRLSSVQRPQKQAGSLITLLNLIPHFLQGPDCIEPAMSDAIRLEMLATAYGAPHRFNCD